MKTKPFLIFIIIVVIIAGSCSPFIMEEINLSKVSIDTGIMLSSAGSRAAAGDVVLFRLKVEADDMETIEKEFTESEISLDVKAGASRTFTLEALDADDNKLFSGGSTKTLTAGQSVSVSITMDYSGFYVSFNTDGAGTISTQYVASGGLVTAPTEPVKTGYTFGGWYTDAAFTTAWNLASSIVNSDITLYLKWNLLAVGNIGPSGGYVFYDKGAYSDGWRYIEAYPVDLYNSIAADYWFYFANAQNGYDVTTTTSAIGSGLENTALIVAQRETANPSIDSNTAAQVCDTANSYGYSDWFLPSYNELYLMYSELHLNSLGSFTDTSYWSSTDTENDDCAWALNFSNGSGASGGNWHSNGGYVRPARRF